MRRFVCTIVMLLAVAPLAADADVYRCNGPNGSIVFSEKPCAPGAKKLEGFDRPAPAPTEPRAEAKRAPAKASPAKQQKSRGKSRTARVELAKGGTEVVLDVPSMRCSRGMTGYFGNRLHLPSGQVVPYSQMRSLVVRKAGGQRLSLEITMRDGEKLRETIEKPWISISGDTAVGSFAKSLGEIARVDFH